MASLKQILPFLILPLTLYAQVDSLWSKTYGGNGDESCNNLIVTDEEDIIITGTSNSFSLSNDYYIQKIDQNGDSIFAFNISSENEEVCRNSILYKNNLILAGQSTSIDLNDKTNADFWIVNTSL